MDITVIYATGRKARSCSYGIAQLLIGSLLDGGTLHEFQLPRDFSHLCVGCYACIEGREDRCGGHDALAPIVAAMERSDLIVFCTPTYVYHTPGQVKALLDHFAYRWVVHRPDLSFMKKQAVIIATGAGGGLRSAARDIKDSTDHWGVARTHVLIQRVWGYDWTTLPDSFRRAAAAKVEKVAARVRRHADRPAPSCRVRALFYLYRFLHRSRKMTPVDDDHWQARGYLTGRPWRT